MQDLIAWQQDWIFEQLWNQPAVQEPVAANDAALNVIGARAHIDQHPQSCRWTWRTRGNAWSSGPSFETQAEVVRWIWSQYGNRWREYVKEGPGWEEYPETKCKSQKRTKIQKPKRSVLLPYSSSNTVHLSLWHTSASNLLPSEQKRCPTGKLFCLATVAPIGEIAPFSLLPPNFALQHSLSSWQ